MAKFSQWEAAMRANLKKKGSSTIAVESKTIKKLSQLEEMEVVEIFGPCIYEAAGEVADAIREELEKVPTDENQFANEFIPKRGPSKKQKAELLRSFGISKLRTDKNGFINVKISFDGYNGIVTKRWPHGQPNPMVARSVVRGTSFMLPNNFVKKAVQKTNNSAKEILKKRFEEDMKKILR